MKRASWLLAGGAALLLAGCGQKGALYLPDKSAQVVTTAAAPPEPAQSTPAPSTPASAAPQKPTDKNDDSQTPK
jgi:predicted small lipoprotein YifL